MFEDNYQLMADGARSITTSAINRELRDAFYQIKSAAEKGNYSVDIHYDSDSDFDGNDGKYFKYKRRLKEMGYSTELNRDKKIMTITW